MKFSASDTELVEFFTSSVGLSAIRYEPRGTGGEFSGDETMLDPRNTRAMSVYVAASSTLASLEAEPRNVLTAVYAPHGAGSTLLSIGLQPTSGGGSFVRVALRTSRVRKAYLRRYPGKPVPSPSALLAFLTAEAGHGDDRASWFSALREECEERRTVALGIYDAARIERLSRERDHRRERKRRLDDLFRFDRLATGGVTPRTRSL